MASQATDINLVERFLDFLKTKNLRNTPERTTLLDYIAACHGHFTIEMIQQMARDNAFHVSRATIYNTVNLLVEARLLRRYDIEGRQIQFELSSRAPHAHLLCNSCGKVKEVSDKYFISFMNTRRYQAFTTEYYSLFQYGTCSTCARRFQREAGDAPTKKK